MKKIFSPVFLAIIAVLFILFPDSDSLEKENNPQNIKNSTQGNVARVIDGDTLEMRSGEKVRLIGINTPEKGQPYGEEAINEMRRLVTNKIISLEFDEEKKDKYNRTLAYVYVDDEFINLHMVEKGLALVETVPPNEKFEGQFMEAEIEAKENCRGLWEGLCVKGEKTSACIKISEIFPDAPGNDNDNLNGEWVTLQNNCTEDIPLDGYLLKDRSASNSYFFKNITLFSKSSLTLYSGCGVNTNTQIYWQCPEKRSSVWNNTTDQAYLYDKEGILVATRGY